MPPVSNKRYVAAFIWHLLFVIILRKRIVCKCFFWNAKKIVSPGKPAKNACFLFLKMVSYMYYEYENAMTKEVECSGSVREWRSPAASRLRNVHLKFPFEHQSWRISGRLRRFGSVMGQECPTIVGNAGGTAEAWLSSQCVDGGFFYFLKGRCLCPPHGLTLLLAFATSVLRFLPFRQRLFCWKDENICGCLK